MTNLLRLKGRNRVERKGRVVWLRCVVCGRRLTTSPSMESGYEQHCAAHFTPDFLEARKRALDRLEALQLRRADQLARSLRR